MLNVLSCVKSVKEFVEDVGAPPPQNPDGTIGGEDTDEMHNKVRPALMDSVALAGIASCVTTMILTDGHVVDASSYSTACLAPYCAYQKHQLQSLGGMRGQQNTLRNHVNQLQTQNKILTKSIDDLESQVTALEGVESQLDAIAKASQSSVERLTQIVKRNGEIQTLIKKNLERKVLADMVSMVVSTDRDRDFTLNDMELNMLILRLNSHDGIDLDEANFRKIVLETSPPPVTLTSLMKVIRNLMDDSVPEEDNVFHYQPSQLKPSNK